METKITPKKNSSPPKRPREDDKDDKELMEILKYIERKMPKLK